MHPAPKVLLVEDDPHFAAWALAELARHCPDLRSAHAASLEEARGWLGQPGSEDLRLAVVDLHLGDGSGIEFISMLARKRADVPILVLTSVDDPEEALRAIREGAQGYLLKLTIDGELGRAVAQIRSGGSPINPGIAHLLLKALRTGQPREEDALARASAELVAALSKREVEVLRLIALGYSDKETAVRLGVAPSTVDTHVRAIYRKLSVHSRAQLRRLIRG